MKSAKQDTTGFSRSCATTTAVLQLRQWSTMVLCRSGPCSRHLMDVYHGLAPTRSPVIAQNHGMRRLKNYCQAARSRRAARCHPRCIHFRQRIPLVWLYSLPLLYSASSSYGALGFTFGNRERCRYICRQMFRIVSELLLVAFNNFMHACLGLYLWDWACSLWFEWDMICRRRPFTWQVVRLHPRQSLLYSFLTRWQLFYLLNRYSMLLALVGSVAGLNYTS